MKPAMIVLALALGLATAAHAGLKNTVGVTVDTVNHKAFGALGEARNSSDSIEAAGCQTSVVAGQSITALCFAIDANGVQVMCSSTDRRIVQVAESIGTDAAFSFSYDPKSGNCLTLLVFNASEFGPKQP
ncbi:MAG TPA: hypothetical protein VFF06_15940 [Polyangia bacterium]|nr:hypothetical protein [Polyangia bacterium]